MKKIVSEVMKCNSRYNLRSNVVIIVKNVLCGKSVVMFFGYYSNLLVFAVVKPWLIVVRKDLLIDLASP